MGICGSLSNAPNQHCVDLSHYEIWKTVGQGGFGKVSAVVRKDDESQQFFALKRVEKRKLLDKLATTAIKLVMNERSILAKLDGCNFNICLVHAFQDAAVLYFVLPFLPGGDLHYHLKTYQKKKGSGGFPEEWVRFYGAEIVLALEELHRRHIVYRDLKPQNLILDEQGHVCLTDFGLAVEISNPEHGLRRRTISTRNVDKPDNSEQKARGSSDEETELEDDGDGINIQEAWDLTEDGEVKLRLRAGTKGYQPPEMLWKEGYGFAADFYSLGVTIHELLTGKKVGVPGQLHSGMSHDSYDAKVQKLYMDEVRLSSRLSKTAKSLIKSLLHPYPDRRLGANGFDEVKQHPFFKSIDWGRLSCKLVKAPIKVDPTKANCFAKFEMDEQLLAIPPKKIDKELDEQFRLFDMYTKIEFCDRGRQLYRAQRRRLHRRAKELKYDVPDLSDDDIDEVDPNDVRATSSDGDVKAERKIGSNSASDIEEEASD